MASNILTGVITITAPGATVVFTNVSKAATKTASDIKVLQKPLSTLGDTLETLRAKLGARMSFLNVEKDAGKIAILNREIAALNAEILRVGNIGKKGFNELGVAVQAPVAPLAKVAGGAKAVLAGMLRISYILPGLGIAGLIGGLLDFASGLFKIGAAFSEAAISGAKFSNLLKELDAALDETKRKLDFSGELQKLSLQLAGFTGAKLDIGGLQIDKEGNLKFIKEATTALEILTKQKDRLKSYADVVVQAGAATKDFGGKEGGLSQLLRTFKDVSQIPEGLVSKLSTKEAAALKNYQNVVKATVETKAKLDRALEQDALFGKQIAVKNLPEDTSKKDAAAAKKAAREAEQAAKEKLALIIRGLKAEEAAIILSLQRQIDAADVIAKDEEKTYEERIAALAEYAKRKTILIRNLALFEKTQPKLIQEEVDLIDKQKLDSLIKLGIETKVQTDKINADKVKAEKKAADEIQKVYRKLSEDIKKELDKRDKDAADAAQKIVDTFDSVLSAGLADTFAAIGEGIGNILSGKDFGNGLTAAIGDMLVNIGKALIQLGVVKKFVENLLKNPFFKSAGAVIAVGIGAIAIGMALKNLKGARALGGPVGAGGAYLVGENGPEIFRPNTGGQIIPNNQIGGRGVGATGGMAVQVSGQFLLRGQDLLASATLAQQSKLRLQ